MFVFTCKEAIKESQLTSTGGGGGGGNDKLRQFLSQIGAAHHISLSSARSEHSDLLLEYRDDENSARCANNNNNNNEELSSTDSVDTLSLLNFLTATNNNSNKQRDHDHDDENGRSSSDDKMIKMLIKLLVKSCRIFDVATQKTDTRISYWRYANPVVALVKQRAASSTNANSNNQSSSAPVVQQQQRVAVVKQDAAVQTMASIETPPPPTNDDESTLNDTVESDGNVKTIIEADKKNGTYLIKSSSSRTSVFARSLVPAIATAETLEKQVSITLKLILS